MTREQQTQCIEEGCDAFKKTLLAKASKIPPSRTHPRDACFTPTLTQRGCFERLNHFPLVA